ncbi:MAG: aminotransferase class III-fold pyridoxal phosphate-dependent enzyme [Myxococcota bacterium]
MAEHGRAGGEPDLEALEVRHAAEEADEASRSPLEARRVQGLSRPAAGELPRSRAWLERLYAGDRVPREKKPPVVDHLRSAGAFLVSVDDPPLSVLDGMSQTATVVGGFAEDPVVARYVEGGFGDTLVVCDDTAVADHWAELTFADRLRTLVPGLPHVSFVNSGAEAAEKALALCRANAPSPERRRVLAFEGSFHGRTLLALHASHNPEKRAPFEIPGHEVTFAPFPVRADPQAREPGEPDGYLAALARGELAAVRSRWLGRGDATIDAELSALEVVHRELSAGDVVAVIVEPMQSEGGDRYATARFFRSLRVLTRHHRVPLVLDEVQTGFGLGGTFAWHARFGLVDADGRPDVPDCVTFAKRAQVGVVMSRFEDPAPTSAHPASLVRGAVHAEMMAGDAKAREVQQAVRVRLHDLEARFPELVLAPRATGYAVAFDLPTPAHLQAFLAQRFYRGAVVFGAGTRTVRYRLSQAWGPREIDLLFDAVRRTLKWMEAHPGETPPAWIDPPPAPRDVVRPSPQLEIRVRRVGEEEADGMLARIVELEERVYEPARRASAAWLRLAFDDPDGVAVVAEARDPDTGDWWLVGCALGTPLEHLQYLGGPDTDPMQGRMNTLYSAAVTVDPEYQGLGIGRRLKDAQLRAAREVRRPDGSPRYRYVSGRNRVGRTDAMMRLNRTYHACELYCVQGVYDDPEAEGWYYRQPLVLPAPDPEPAVTDTRHRPRSLLQVGSGLARPFARAPESLLRAQEAGLLYGPAVNKLTLCNYVTPAVVRAMEWVDAQAPSLGHLYLASSRDECFDKTVRAFKWHRGAGAVVIGLEGGYVGHTTAAARSLSDPAVHAQGPGYFRGWPRVPHPAVVGTEATLDALREAVRSAGGADRVLGFFVEPVQERTGHVVPDGFWRALASVHDELDVPVALVETAAGCFRSGRGAFASSATSFVPDALLWWGGGQVGFVHLADRWHVPKPLTLVSTWDGDELSLVRVHHQLRAARGLDVASRAEALDRALTPVVEAGLAVRGCGLYRVIDAGSRERALAMAERLWERGVDTRSFANGCVVVAPTLDVDDGGLARLRAVLGEACA